MSQGTVPRQIPTPPVPAGLSPQEWKPAVGDVLRGYLEALNTRLQNWTSQASTTLQAHVMNQVELEPVPDGVRTEFTVPYTLATAEGGKPNALLFAPGAVAYTPADPPPPGRWTLRADGTIVLGTAPAAGDPTFFGFLVSR